MSIKLAVGYQLPEEGEEPSENIIQIVEDYCDQIEEVYFPWLDLPTCRSPLTIMDGIKDWSAQNKLEADLKKLKNMGIKLDLLLNANCYGQQSVSKYFENLICSVVSYLKETIGLDIVTTASLMVARTVKINFPDIEVRTSVNMRIGTVKAMEYIADLFDSYNIQREYNRDFQRISELKEWADKHGKKITFLVNSGCLNFCSGQIFHDNLVAHESEISQMKNIFGWNPSLCWNFYKDRNNWVSLLQNSWIRPEDLDNYTSYFSLAKLATRMHSNPRKVVQSYVERRFNGNLLDLFEPSHSPLLMGYIIDNTRFPEDWFKKVTSCDKKCYSCDYCDSVLKKVLVKII